MEFQTHKISVSRSARYCVLPAVVEPVKEIWIVLHGYGQLASYFLRNFATLTTNGACLIVAPEALSRFYLGDNQWQRVGASWMTKEDREDEIEDQVAYLNAVYEVVKKQTNTAAHVQLVVFGFSQGTATAWRWIERAKMYPQHVVVWAGSIPPETAHFQTLQNTTVWTVFGNEDPFVTAERTAEVQAILAKTGLPHRHIGFEGGHTIPIVVLQQLQHEMATLAAMRPPPTL
jgi:predicted esterase